MEQAPTPPAPTDTPLLRLALGLKAPDKVLSLGGCLLTLVLAMAAIGWMALPGWWRWLALAAVLLGEVWRRHRPPRQPMPLPPEPLAWLLLYETRVVVVYQDGSQHEYLLDASTHVRLAYSGYQGETRSGVSRRSSPSYHSGYDNNIQFNDGRLHPFLIPDQATEEALRRQLHHWYARRVDLHEYRLGSRTVLLRAEPDYDEQMQLLRDYGFSLYGRQAPPPRA